MKTRERVFSRFERFWHWFQAVLIIALMITGFEVNGAYALVGYEEAAGWHRACAWVLIWLWVFAIFWHLVTGEWKQYIPTTERLMAVMKYYSVGIFDHSVPHPYKKTVRFKHNPLQRIAYLSFNIAITPVIWITGLLYMYYNDWPANWGLTLGDVALVHVAAAFAMLIFFIAHVYMAFTGHPPMQYVKAMITGYDDVYPEEKGANK
ncbi:cytochrome b/b6 domain-containing protein [Magnetofaba australis]|uniref:Putative hydrogenase, b-type cytochrome subunit n=1 Tax=Magnetofaba australis IT-1 TaxID=1434232 RepID=A0A1Y2K3X9_9PROT|nr:cytochrome b/b6 domain-containing protein [Magnetofaba australis]OSM03976.1 putative hydrogenase, b-type cytochrome subunit [Magnetofaba australis IT-1]